MAAIINVRDLALQSVVPRYATSSSTLERSTIPWTNLAQSTFDPSVVNITKTVTSAVLTPAGSDSTSFVPSGSGSHYMAAATNVALSSSSTPFKVGIYVKNLTGSYKVALKVTTKTSGSANNTVQRGVNSSLVQDGSLTSTGSGFSSIVFGVQPLSNGWAKLTITGTYTKQASENQIDYGVYILNASGSESYTGDGSSGFYMYGPTLFLNEQPNDTIGDIWIDSTTKFSSPWNGHAWMTPEAALPTKQGIVYLYRRSATALTDSDKPASNVYNFNTSSFTAAPTNSWTPTIPTANGNPVYVIACTPVDDDGDDLATVPTEDWSTPVVLTQDGAKSAQVLLYQRTSSSTAPSPATPTATITYTFADGSISPTTPGNNWSTNIPAASNGAYLWVIKAVALNNGTTDTIATGEWSSPAVLSQDGAAGEGISCVSTSLVTAISETNVYTPSSITLSVLRGSSIAGGSPSNSSYVWSVLSGTFTGSTSTVNSSTGAMNSFTPSSHMGTDQVQFQCTYTHNEPGSAYHNKVYTDRITITKIREAAGITGVLTNESHTVPAGTNGAVSSYSGATGTFKVYYGIADVTTSCSFAYISNTGFSSAPTGSINATTGVYTISSGIDTAAAVATVTYRATYTHPVKGAVTVDKVFSITKATTGSNGATGSTGAQAVKAYSTRTGSALPSAPTDIGTNTVPTAGNAPTSSHSTTWYTLPPSGNLASNCWLFQVDGTYNGSTYTWNTQSYLSTFKVGQLSALSADIGTVTAGTVIGATIKTASSNARVELDGASNTLRGFNSSNVLKFYVDMSSGYLKMDGYSALGFGAVDVTQDATSISPAIKGISNNTGSGVTGQCNGTGPGIYGVGQSGYGVHAKSFSGTSLYVEGTMAISSTSLVTNLNADRLDNLHAGTWNSSSSVIPIINGSDGVLEVGRYIDFHGTNSGAADYSVRLYNAGTSNSTLGESYLKVKQNNGTSNDQDLTVLAGADAGAPGGSAISSTTCPSGIGSTALKWIRANLNGTTVYIPYVS